MANQYIKGIRLIDKAGEYTGSYVKLTPIWHGAGTEAVFSHMTFGQQVHLVVSSSMSALKPSSIFRMNCSTRHADF